jgi:hypothetical protein
LTELSCRLGHGHIYRSVRFLKLGVRSVGFIEAALSNAMTSADTCKFVHGGGDATNLRAKISGRGPAFRSAQPE